MYKKPVDIETKRLYANLALRWCRDNLGINRRRKKIPKLSVLVRFIYENDDAAGIFLYKENKIIIYEINCSSIESVVSTIIHEYTHYLQSMKKYWGYFITHDYKNHPFEVEARRNEEKYTKKCIRDIKKLINYV